MSNDTHKTKDGRIAKKGLYYYVNKKKKEGRKPNPVGSDKAPTEKDWYESARTAKQ